MLGKKVAPLEDITAQSLRKRGNFHPAYVKAATAEGDIVKVGENVGDEWMEAKLVVAGQADGQSRQSAVPLNLSVYFHPLAVLFNGGFCRRAGIGDQSIALRLRVPLLRAPLLGVSK